MKKSLFFLMMLLLTFSFIDANEGVSLMGVKYEKSVSGFLNNKTADIREASLFRLSSNKVEENWIPVLVDVKDVSGINISNKDDSDFKIELNNKKNFLMDITYSILNNLSKDEFELKTISSNGKWFSGNISERGFCKLLNDSRIEKIHDNTLKGSLDLVESVPLIGANQVWSLDYSGEDQTVCIIDTGVDYSVVGFGSCSEFDFLNGYCEKVIGGYDFYDNDNNPMDEYGHGTEVAGVIASTNYVYTGVTPNVSIVALKITDDDGDPSAEAMRLALDWCLDNSDLYNISVVTTSISWHNLWGPCGRDFADYEINALYAAGIPVVASAGNDGNLEEVKYPACAENTIAVGAIYDQTANDNWDYCNEVPTEDMITCFSNRGSLLDLVAPGAFIDTLAMGGGIESYTFGTSVAAPHVAGAIALLKEANPSLTSPSEISELLQNTSVPVYDSKSDTTYGRIDVAAALNATCDADNDGYFSTGCKNGNDCDDSNAGVNPGMDEFCDGVDNDCDSVVDEDCEGSEYEEIDDDDCDFTECSVSGYDSCIDWDCSSGCHVRLAINDYSENEIRWGEVVDDNDPYVVGSYEFGWSLVSGEDVYRDVVEPGEDGEVDCTYEDGCSGNPEPDDDVKSIVHAPGVAWHGTVLGYDKEGDYACWAWFNEFSPNYGGNNPIYVLNCYEDGDCSAGEYCDKVGDWGDWDCVSQKGDGQECLSDSECSSGFCDSDGVGRDDDGICFTPYETYFDGEEEKFCEVSTGYGDVECDEREVGVYCNEVCEYNVGYPDDVEVLSPVGGEVFGTGDLVEISWDEVGDSDNSFLRYFLEFSNDSGSSWFSVVSDFGYLNSFSDGSFSRLLSFSGGDDETFYIELPKDVEVRRATLDLEGLSL